MSLACMRIQLRRPACLRNSYRPSKRIFGTWVMQVVYACQQLHNTQLTALQEACLGQAEDHSL